MPGKWATAFMLLILVMPSAADDEQQPDTELLEYLGEWTGTDKDWPDPVDILDMNLDDKKETVSESGK